MLKFFSHIQSVIKFLSLHESERKIVFYSEGKDYWPHLAGIIEKLIEIGHSRVCYITSDKSDPGLSKTWNNYSSFITDEGPVRNWLFQNMPSCVLVMTMPDLHNFQVKRSINPVHYIYNQHSLVSLHSAYRNGAFDHYDTIFCAGPHHVQEMRAIEKLHSLPAKTLVKHGYTRLDQVREEDGYRQDNYLSNQEDHILIAPTWGTSGIIEQGLAQNIIQHLLLENYHVVMRPHPQTFKLCGSFIDDLVKKFEHDPRFKLETSTENTDSLRTASVMITDWSGAAYDFAFGYQKPVLFVDTPAKINNLKFKDFNLISFEQSVRSNLGMIVQNPSEIANLVKEVLASKRSFDENKYVFNLGESSRIAAEYLIFLSNQTR